MTSATPESGERVKPSWALRRSAASLLGCFRLHLLSPYMGLPASPSWVERGPGRRGMFTQMGLTLFAELPAQHAWNFKHKSGSPLSGRSAASPLHPSPSPSSNQRIVPSAQTAHPMCSLSKGEGSPCPICQLAHRDLNLTLCFSTQVSSVWFDGHHHVLQNWS